MHTFDWFLVGLWLFNMAIVVSAVGKPRKPMEAHVAAIVALIDVALIAGLLISRGVL